ncbi:type II secretion system F family protein [Streptomyces sp. PSKA54]|uniref:Type II secretion system F family protein n=1 Tax=Streptomyces himalayensis subsp. aureolus TaxID=2758039 RepID=A0A7W2D7J6_9ACTN|nr:type II secretion system F family protein [Streptomyces himalayensis]MBA4866223.1 type II secretion system F family protein [Streptomyces himalayensis subsp. aureolus]
MTLLWGLLSGMAVMGGLVGVVAGVVGTTAPRTAPLRKRWQAAAHARQQQAQDIRLRRRTLATGGIVVCLAVWLVCGNFVAGALLGSAVIGVPWLITPARIAQERIGQLEGLSEWTQRLAGLLRLGMGLEQAMITSRKGAPTELAGQVINLSDRLRLGWRPEEALHAFADELDDITADKVAAALILSAGDRGPGLAQALEDLAATVREEVAGKRKVEADRAKSRTTVRWMTFLTLGIIVAGFFVPSYTAPYATLLGQLVLAFLTAGFVGTLALMRSLSIFRRIARFLVADPRSTVRLPAPLAEPAVSNIAGEPEGVSA